MYTDLTLKLKALTMAVLINGLIMGGAAFLFDGQLHQGQTISFDGSHVPNIASVHASVFRP
jgi:hypothetical protein